MQLGCSSDSGQGGQATAITGAAGGAAQSGGLQVQLASGSLQGKQVGSTREYLGIPYAKAPVGPLRFAPPQPAEPWTGVRDATAYGPSCSQGAGALSAMGPQSEDCLSLNVFAPEQASSTKPLPVMVFIHGGAFTSGGSLQYPGEALSSARR